MTVFPRDLVPRILLSLSFIGRERNQITCSQGVSHPLGNNCLRLQHPRVIKCRISILESLKILLSYPFKQILQISRFLIALHFGFGIHVQGGDLRAKDEGRRDLQLVQQRISSSTKGIEDVQYIHDQTAPPIKTRNITESSSSCLGEKMRRRRTDGRKYISTGATHYTSNARRRRGVVNSPPFNELEICVGRWLASATYTHKTRWLAGWLLSLRRRIGEKNRDNKQRQNSAFCFFSRLNLLHLVISDSYIRQ